MRHTTVREIVLATFLTAMAVSPAVLTTLRAQTAPGGFPDLVAGLKATPGCLGVETARTASGKQPAQAGPTNDGDVHVNL